MGNSRWRLETALNYAGRRVEEIGREPDVEILIADWGSEIPLREELRLCPAAARIVSFVWIPPDTARELQQDSPFPEVLALNAAARRAGGQYIGRIDQDTLIGQRFFDTFFDFHAGTRKLEVPINEALLFANQRMVPYRFTVRSPALPAVELFIRSFGRKLKIELTPRRCFYNHGVGIWLVHRNLWNECGGYDERMLYMNSMETNMVARLMQKYTMVDLGRIVNYDFYHLEHYHPLEPRQSSTHRRVNDPSFRSPTCLHPNSEDWGLIRYPFESQPYSGSPTKVYGERAHVQEWLRFLVLSLLTGIEVASDRVVAALRRSVWRRRARLAWDTVAAQPLRCWPGLLMDLWIQKQSRQKGWH